MGHTGGCSSTFSPRSGLAFRLANTPSLDSVEGPFERLRLEEKIEGKVGIVLVNPARAMLSWVLAAAASRIRRWRSSSAVSLSSSAFGPASKVSSRVWSTGPEMCLRDAIDDARDRNGGGGEAGTCR